EERRLPRARRPHERLERALRNFEVQVIQDAHRLFAAEERLRYAFEIDDGLFGRAIRSAVRFFVSHHVPFSLTFCPSSRSGGGLVTMRVPLAGPSRSSKLLPFAPSPRRGPNVTGATCTTFPSMMNATFLPLRSVTAEAGMTFLGASFNAASL